MKKKTEREKGHNVLINFPRQQKERVVADIAKEKQLTSIHIITKSLSHYT